MIDPAVLRRVRLGQVVLKADAYCPTWQREPFTGWRRFLIYRLGPFSLPRRWFKPPRKFRVAYAFEDTVVVSFETYAAIMKAIDDGEGQDLPG